MPRLPVPGSDDGQWGEILNDFLIQAHTPNGSIRPNSITESQLTSSVQTKINTVAGSDGATGPVGPQGATGAQGATGPVGPSGIVVLAAGDPDPSPAIDGVLYVRLTGDIVDSTAPSVPTGLASGTLTASTIQVSWSASTDNTGVSGYQVRIDGGSPISASGLSYTFSGLDPNTQYDIAVRAGDAAGNWSAWSGAIQASTSAGTGGLLFSDNFNRTNGTAGNGWIDYAGGTSGVAIVSNSLQVSGYGNYARGARQQNFPLAVSVRATFTSTIDAFQGIFLGHSTSTNNGIKIFNNGGAWVIGDSNTYYGSNTAVAFTNTPASPYTSLRLDFDGTTITAYINDVVVHTMLASSLGFSLDTAGGNIYEVGYCGEATTETSHAEIDLFEVYEA